MIGWIGARLGSPVLGHWPGRIPNLHHEEVWYILGALALIIVAVERCFPDRKLPDLKNSRNVLRALVEKLIDQMCFRSCDRGCAYWTCGLDLRSVTQGLGRRRYLRSR